ncbi:MAG TPA: MFS transporter [Bryobacteraceae bacterium]|nr:MFS transporter [Bryobacteraceae bacterium]
MHERRRWRIAILLGIGVLVNYFDRVNLSVAHEALHSEFGLTNEGYGYLLGAYGWTYAALQLPVGSLLDRFGVQLIGRIGAFIWSVASFAAAAANSVTTFFGARLLLGIGEAPTFPANAKAVGYWFPGHERSLATAFFDAAAKFASGVGVPAFGLVLIRFGWRLSFAATGLVSMLYFVLFYFVYCDPRDDKKLSTAEWKYIQNGEEERPPSDKPHPAPLTYLLKQPKVLGLACGFGAYNYCFYLFLFWLPSYFAALHMSQQNSVLFTGVPWIFATATDLLVGGWLVDLLIQRGRDANLVRKTILIGGTVLGLALAGVMFTKNPIVAAFWISLSLGGLSAAAPVGWSLPSLIAPRDSVGKVGGILNFANQISSVVAPISTAYFIGATNAYGRAFAAAAVILAIGICGYIFLLGRIEPVPEPATS